MKLFAISVLLQREDADGTTTTTHTLHWRSTKSHEEAIASAIEEAKRLKPTLEVVDVLCADTGTGGVKRLDYETDHSAVEY